MAEKIVTVKTWDEFKNAMNIKIKGYDTIVISITADLMDTEQHPLPAPATNYWATIEKIGTSSGDADVKIIGNNHTISGINIPDNYYTAFLLYKSTAGGTININIYNLKFINIKTPTVQVYDATGSGISSINLTNCVITGIFDLYHKITELTQCNIVQMSPRTQNIRDDYYSYYFIAENLYYTHYYYTHLNNITGDNRQLAGTFDNCYIELNPGMTNLVEHTILGGWRYYPATFKQSCINCNKKLNLSLDYNYISATGVTILNCTNEQSDIPAKLANNIKIITDEQMKNADYLNSIGFTVTPTN